MAVAGRSAASPASPAPPASTRRGQERRERILESAARLVATRGFHSVGVSDIGAAAGVTGSALYRHFPNKSEILVALLDRVVDQLLEGAQAVVSSSEPSGASPAEMLRTLIAAHVDFAVGRQAILAVYAQEAHNLEAADRRRLRAKQRRYVDLWVDLYRRVHADRPEVVARLRVEAVFGLLNSVPNLSADIDSSVVHEELRRLAEVALVEAGG
jgi:AcrR family transcriptional regulator